MNAKKFVMELGEIPIDVRKMRHEGISDDYINDLVNSYQIKAKRSSSVTDNPIIDLVNNYDVTKLQIGMIGFDDRIKNIGEYTFFGRFEIDHLVINTTFGTILMIENGSDHVLYECAQSGEKFLDALVIAAGFLEKRAMDDKLYDDQVLTCKIAEECGNIAGSPSCVDFYKILLGCDS